MKKITLFLSMIGSYCYLFSQDLDIVSVNKTINGSSCQITLDSYALSYNSSPAIIGSGWFYTYLIARDMSGADIEIENFGYEFLASETSYTQYVNDTYTLSGQISSGVFYSLYLSTDYTNILAETNETNNEILLGGLTCSSNGVSVIQEISKPFIFPTSLAKDQLNSLRFEPKNIYDLKKVLIVDNLGNTKEISVSNITLYTQEIVQFLKTSATGVYFVTNIYTNGDKEMSRLMMY